MCYVRQGRKWADLLLASFKQTEVLHMKFPEFYTIVTAEVEFIVCFEIGRFLSYSNHFIAFPLMLSISFHKWHALFVQRSPFLTSSFYWRDFEENVISFLFLVSSSFFLVLFSFYQQHFLSHPLWFPSHEINSLVSYKLNTITAIKTGVFLSL